MINRSISFFVAATAFAVAGTAHAAGPSCPPRAIRWQDDCAALAGQKLEGLDRLRYIPLGERSWLTLGGETHIRAESLDARRFGVDADKVSQLGGRVLLDADLHVSPRLRGFVQVGVVDQTGRKDAREQDRNGPDATQLFVDAPAPGPLDIVARLGRQEVDLSRNRLVTTRDGVSMRRSFQGAEIIAKAKGARLTAFSMHPVDLRTGPFNDGVDRAEFFDGLSLDLPKTQLAQLNLFAFQRIASTARWNDFTGRERRWTSGAHMVAEKGPIAVDAQASYQWGRTAAGQTIRASALSTITTYRSNAAHEPRLVITASYASGDRRKGDGKVNTFDPLYPNNFGLSTSPLLYQTNYVIVGGQAVARYVGTEFALGGYVLHRKSDGDGVYAERSVIPGTTGLGMPTAVMLQANTRTPVGKRAELVGVLVQALAGDNVRRAGGRDATYLRLDLVTRF